MHTCDNQKQLNLQNPSIEHLKIEFSNFQPVLDNYKNTPGSLISILQKAQDIYGYLPMNLLLLIAHETKIKPAKILGVVTFYAQFRMEPVGKNLISLCQGTACHVNGSPCIEAVICEELGVKKGETTADRLFTLNSAACLGCCSLSPVMMINDETYGSLTPSKVLKIIKETKDREHNKYSLSE